MKHRLFQMICTVALTGMAMLHVGCSEDDPEFDPVDVTLTINAYTTAQFNLLDLILPRAHAAVSSLTMCFTSATFTITDVPDTDILGSILGDSVTVNINEGDLVIPTAGVTLQNAKMAQATYSDISLTLDNHCASGESISLTNGNGSYDSADTITISIAGSFTVTENSTVVIDLQDVITALNNHNGGSLKTDIEAVEGSVSSN